MRPRVLQTLGHIVDFKREQWMDKDSLEKLQQKRFEEILRCAYQANYYRKIFKEHCLNGFDLLDIPLTSKESVRNSSNDFVSANPSGELKVLETSGSSGLPTKIFVDKKTFENSIALTYAVAMESCLSPFDRFAEVTYVPYAQHPLLSKLGIFKKIVLSVFDDESENLEKIRNTRANILGWYPTLINVMANLNREADKPLKLKSVFSSGEFLSESVRRNIEDSFSCPVFNKYGNVEFGTCCFECPQEHNMHVIGSSNILEIVDEKGKPKKSGIGEVVITGLVNKAMPLIRYRIGDRASWGEECPCGRGFPTLKSLEGRSDDMIVLPSGRVRSAQSINFVGDLTFVLYYQIIQEKEDLFVFRYVPSKKGLSNSEKEEITIRIKKVCLDEEVSVEFEEVNSIERGRTGKIKKVISKVRKFGQQED